MREVHGRQFEIGQTAIEKIWINSKPRDDPPALSRGLQHLWCERELRDRVFSLLDEHVSSVTDRTVGRSELAPVSWRLPP